VNLVLELESTFFHIVHISELDKNILNFKNIEELILSENKLTELPKEIGKLTNLKWLVVSDNQLLKVPSSICNESSHLNFN
jgi:Leucine-rich repeat (LRR) protein